MDKRKLFDYSLKTFLFLSPLFFFRQYQLSFARGLFFIFGTFTLFALSLGIEQKRKLSDIYLSIFFILAVIRVFFDNDVVGVPQAEWFNFWLISCSNLIYVLCAVLLFYTVYTYSGDVKKYLKPVLLVSILNLILVISQKFNYDFMWNNTPSINGFMENSSQLGQYSALAMPIAFLINPYLIFIPAVTLLISGSISPILSGFIGLCFMFRLLRIKKIIALISVIGVIAVIFNFGYIKTKWSCRPVMWKKTLNTALQRPFLGHGYQSFNEKVLKQDSVFTAGKIEYSRPHNDYFHTAQELGFPIVISFFMFLFGIFKRFIMLKKKEIIDICLFSSVLIIIINMFGQSLIRYSSVAGTFIVLLALLSARIKDAGVI